MKVNRPHKHPRKFVGMVLMLCLLSFCTIYLHKYAESSIDKRHVNSLDFEFHGLENYVSVEDSNSDFARKDDSNKGARVWRIMDSSKWCVPRKTERVNRFLRIKGLLFVKIPKTGSTTLSGLTLRIGYRHSHLVDGCHIEACHGEAWKGRKNYLNRDLEESFLFTFVRHPSTRAISQAHHFHINLEKFEKNEEFQSVETTDAEMIAALQKAVGEEHNCTNYQMFYLQTENPHFASSNVSHVINQYDFIGVFERFDESLVVLRFLLGLDASDIVYFQSKNPKLSRSGIAYDHGCRPITSYKMTPAIEAYLNSKEWIKSQEVDLELLDVANRSLDLTIDTVIGRDKFEAALKEHRSLMERIHRKCDPIFPCSNGQLQVLDHRECYVHDSGCAFSCIDGQTSEYPPVGGFEAYVSRLRNTKYCYLGCAAEKNCEVKTQVYGWAKKAWENIVFDWNNKTLI